MKIHLNPLEYKTIGLLDFELGSSLHIGIGGEEVQREFLRLPTGELVIPSSTWKGAFRNISEQLAKSMKFNGIAALAVESYYESKSGITYRSDKNKFEKFAEDFVKTLRGIPSGGMNSEELVLMMKGLGYTEEDILEVREKGLEAAEDLARIMAEDYIAINCPIGKLYGNRTITGKVRFFDSIFNAKTHFRPGIGIERSSGKVKENALYFSEIVSFGNLRLTFIADNLSPGADDSKLFANTLEAIKFVGISIGGRKSVGMGHLKLSNGIFYIVDFRKDENLAIGNPFKKGEKFNLESFISWIRG
ncbi:MAG: RAMP superfamily CRISPR-associated protein [Thermoproteota archaeon]